MVRSNVTFTVAWTVGTLIIAQPASAQFVNNVCGTMQGPCQVNPAPVGSPCGCYTNFGPAPGQILPQGGAIAPQQMQAVSNVCRTYKGVCQVNPAPVGSACGCYGDIGAVIPR